jgi:hypothetical protein
MQFISGNAEYGEKRNPFVQLGRLLGRQTL